jgi:hypothetical protein
MYMTQVTEQQVREIVIEEIKPLDDDFKSAKRWALGLFFSILSGALVIGIWVGTIQEQVTHIEEDQVRFEDKIEEKLVRIENLLLQLTKEINN